jgi:AcrR family transcriptional regulator
MTSRERILQAADRRFADYGYTKTTMAEIAGDADMSVGNLYRHFRNKEELAAASVARLLERKLAEGVRAARGRNDALAALEAFLLTRLRVAHAHFADTRHLFDMMRFINERHRDMLLEYERRVIAALADILREGVRQGRFAIDDAERTAYDIHQATMRYNHPVALKFNRLDTLETDLRRLIALLNQGLAPRNSKEVQQ